MPAAMTKCHHANDGEGLHSRGAVYTSAGTNTAAVAPYTHGG